MFISLQVEFPQLLEINLIGALDLIRPLKRPRIVTALICNPTSSPNPNFPPSP